MTRTVIDASIVVRWYIADDPLHAEALAIKRRVVAIAPALIQAETANALWRYVRRGLLRIEDACESVAVLPDILTLTEDRHLVGAAQRISATKDHPIYDCLYLALAQREAAELVTADKRLGHLAQEIGVPTTLVQLA